MQQLKYQIDPSHKVIYEGQKYKLVQITNLSEVTLSSGGYDGLFLNKHTKIILGKVKSLRKGGYEVSEMPINGIRRFKNLGSLIQNLPKLINAAYYSEPALGECKVVYRSKRYVIIEIGDNQTFEFLDKSTCDYAFYDCKFDAITGTIDVNEDGTLNLNAMTNWVSDKIYKTMRELAKDAPFFINSAFHF